MQNVITVGELTLNIANKERPFSNNFVQQSAKIVQYKGKDEILAYVLCTADSQEPGRIYIVSYSLKGKLYGCSTVN